MIEQETSQNPVLVGLFMWLAPDKKVKDGIYGD